MTLNGALLCTCRKPGFLGIFGKATVITIHEDGFVVEDRGGTVSYRWADLVAYTHDEVMVARGGAIRPVRISLVLATADGKTHSITQAFSGAVQAAQILPELTFQPLLRRAHQQLEDTGRVAFGDLVLTTTGLAIRAPGADQREVPWADIASLETQGATLMIWQHNRTQPDQGPLLACALELGTLPNAFVCIALLKLRAPDLDQTIGEVAGRE